MITGSPALEQARTLRSQAIADSVFFAAAFFFVIASSVSAVPGFGEANVQWGRAYTTGGDESGATLSSLLWNTEGLDLGIEVRADPMTNGEQTNLPRSTGVLYALCKFNSDRCEGYLTGVADILLAMGNSHIAGGICNAEYDSANLRKVFAIWVERHPDNLQDDMAISAQAAFRELWPCT